MNGLALESSSQLTTTIQHPSPQAGHSAPLHHASDSTSSIQTLMNSSEGLNAARSITRTPSPTPSEVEALAPKGTWKDRLAKQKSKFLSLPRRKQIIYAAIGVTLTTLIILLSVFNNNIVLWLQPKADKIRNLKGGWLIPIAILFVLSFPPLFGQEIILAVVGMTWGFWIGVGIASAGTFLGEVANFFTFKAFCLERGRKWERTQIDYACLAQVMREGGLFVAIVVRYSIVPPHYATAVFATCGMRFWVFAISAIVSLPQYYVSVFIGKALGDSSRGHETTGDKIATYVTLIVSTVITYVAYRHMKTLTAETKPKVIYARRKARQAKLFATSVRSIENNSSTEILVQGPDARDESQLEHGDVESQVTHYDYSMPSGVDREGTFYPSHRAELSNDSTSSSTYLYPPTYDASTRGRA